MDWTRALFEGYSAITLTSRLMSFFFLSHIFKSFKCTTKENYKTIAKNVSWTLDYISHFFQLLLNFNQKASKEKSIKRCSWVWKSTLFYVFLLIFSDSWKEVWHKIFDFSFFFMNKLPLAGPLSISLGPFKLVTKISVHLWKFMFTTGVIDTNDKLFTSPAN